MLFVVIKSLVMTGNPVYCFSTPSLEEKPGARRARNVRPAGRLSELAALWVAF